MSTALWNDLAPAPRPAGWGAATHVAAGLWRVADPRGLVVGHIRAIAAEGGLAVHRRALPCRVGTLP
ncbi:hypothetical protein [Microbacterium sp. BH-3-3-3]|uniref:hypothetical protein n=1 Tax=Microbacterium sp. BH-3-3-3 TaxID=1906742 RepID=UPI0008927DB0|nr:hypothetical protein [Microbacterium sp. BH-3-3-3]AOX44443.1 hypothetical protein BJP65_00390 [Microbacterium sp. BH-3-3-3]